MDSPLVSVIIPVYNVEKYLHQCLDSVLNQSYKNLEIILVDDGSTDRCGEICDLYAHRDPRIKVFHQENKGLSRARNTGLSQVCGKYITFIDSDDWLKTDAIEIMYTNLIKFGAKICGVGFYQVYENGRLIKNSS